MTAGPPEQGAPGAPGPLLVLDGMSLAFRAYFALPPDLTTSAGVVTNALHGFVSMLSSLVRDHHPTGMAVAFDLPGPTFRDALVEEYKGGRAATPDDLVPQFAMIETVVSSLGIPVVSSEGYEADDVLATLATRARDRHRPVVVVTGDRDSYQLVEDPYVRVLYNRRGVSDYVLYDEEGIAARTGVAPRAYPTLAALRGDPSDNLPGVPGVGEKTAAKLVNEYGDLDGLYAHLDALSPKLRENLRTHEQRVRANAEVIPLVRDVPIGVSDADLELGAWDEDEVRSTFEAFELRTLWTRLRPLLRDGAFGSPRSGSSGGGALAPSRGRAGKENGPAGARGEDGPGPVAGAPGPRDGVAAETAGAALSDQVVVTLARSVADAVAALGELRARTASDDAPPRAALAVSGAWEGAPGRTRLTHLAFTSAPGIAPTRTPEQPALDTPEGGPAARDGALQPTAVGVVVLGPKVTGRLYDGASREATGLLGAAAPLRAGSGDSPEPAALHQALVAATGADGAGLVVHDAKSLMDSLLPLDIDAIGLRLDTSVAAYLLHPSDGRYGLADVARRHLGVDLDGAGLPDGEGQGALDLRTPEAGADAAEDKDGSGTTNGDGAGGGGPADAVVETVALAAATVARLAPVLLGELDGVGERRLSDDIETPLVRVLAKMEVTGIAVDPSVLRAIGRDLVEECRSFERQLHELAGETFNVNSVPQLRTVLYERLGLKPVRKTKTGYSTDARTLEQLRYQHPFVEVLLRYREVEKLRSTYGDALLAEIAADGRIHATFHQTVARTGRLSSDRPNLHNIPVRTPEGRRFREAFVPAPGCRLLVADYDQIELRAIAHLSGDPGLTAAFAAGRDVHTMVASRVFGVPPEEVTPAQRSTAKMVSYGLAYGMEAYGLAQRLAVPVEEATAILTSFFEAFPAVRASMDQAVAEARERGYTLTAFGRRRALPELRSHVYQLRQAAERQAMNAGIQGLAADVFKLALIRLDHALEAEGCQAAVVLQVHDEVLVEVPSDEEDRVFELTRRALTDPVELSVPLPVSMAWGSSWAEAKGG